MKASDLEKAYLFALEESAIVQGAMSALFVQCPLADWSLPEQAYYATPFYTEAQAWREKGCQSLSEDMRDIQTAFICAEKNKRATFDALNMAARACVENAPLYFIVPIKMGAKSYAKNLGEHGFEKEQKTSKSHCVIFELKKIKGINFEAEIWFENAHGYQVCSGIYGHDKIDQGSALLAEYFTPHLKSPIADFGCGYGYLSDRLLSVHPDAEIVAYDNDKRAVEACAQNLETRHANRKFETYWWDLRTPPAQKFKTIIMNPPFHEGKAQDIGLGQACIETAARSLKQNGTLLMVANRHLPYEQILRSCFKRIETLEDAKGFKVIKAQN